MKFSLLFFSVTLLVSSCTTNSFDDLEPIQSMSDSIPSLTVTYQDVRFVFDNVCTACHSNPPQNGAPMSLENFFDAREAVLNRGLLDRISRSEGALGLMPLGGPRLPQTTIDLLIQWNEDGLLEN